MRQSQNIEDELKRINRALRLLSTSNQMLLRAHDESVLLYDVCQISTEIGGYSLSWVGYKELDDEQSVRPAAHCGYNDGFLSAAKMLWADEEQVVSAMSTVIRTGTTQLRHDILNDPRLTTWYEDARSRNYLRCHHSSRWVSECAYAGPKFKADSQMLDFEFQLSCCSSISS